MPATPAQNREPAAPLNRFADYFRYRPTVRQEDLSPEQRASSMRKVIVAWGFGMIYFQAITSAPLVGMFRELGATAFWIGVLAAIPSFAMISQLIGSYITTVTGSRKRLFLRSAYPARLAWAAVVWLALFMEPGMTTVLILLSIILVARVADFMAGPAWFSWASDLIPERERGRFWARRQMVGAVSGMAGMLVLNYFMGDTTPFWKYVVFFTLASVVGFMDVFIHRGASGIVVERDERPKGFREMALGPIRDRQFSPLLVFVLCFSFASNVGGSMFFLMMLEEIHLTYFEISLYVAGLLGTVSALSSPIWGKVVDNFREGARLSYYISCLIVVITAFMWPFIGPRQHLLIAPTVALAGAGWAGLTIAASAVLTGFSPARDRPAYIAMYTVFAGIGATAGGLTGGSLAEHFLGIDRAFGPLILTQFRTVYLIGAFLLGLTLLLLPMIRQPDSLTIGTYARRLFGMNPLARRTYIWMWDRINQPPSITPPMREDSEAGTDARGGC